MRSTASMPARFVAKLEVAAWPVIGALAQRVGTIFIKRGCFRSAARTVGAVAGVLCKGESVAVFPEATTSDGRGLLHFFPAMFQAAVLTGARVQPVALRYRGADGAPTTAAAFVGEMSIADSLRLLSQLCCAKKPRAGGQRLCYADGLDCAVVVDASAQRSSRCAAGIGDGRWPQSLQ